MGTMGTRGFVHLPGAVEQLPGVAAKHRWFLNQEGHCPQSAASRSKVVGIAFVFVAFNRISSNSRPNRSTVLGDDMYSTSLSGRYSWAAYQFTVPVHSKPPVGSVTLKVHEMPGASNPDLNTRHKEDTRRCGRARTHSSKIWPRSR